MPELPEVEVVRAGLERHVVGATITSVEVFHPRPVRRYLPGAAAFSEALVGHRIVGARRRGKYLWLPLDTVVDENGDPGDALTAHLGMSGQLLVQPPESPPERHLRVRLGLIFPDRPAADGPIEPPASPGTTLSPQGEHSPQLVRRREAVELRFVDQRMFGGLSISVGGAVLPPEIVHIARDPIDPEFDDEQFVTRVRRSTSGIKRLLLTQTLISGVGNIYADEALWRAQIHGERQGLKLSATRVHELLAAVREVMGEALAQGGTSFDALYVNVNGESGYFDRSLHAYGREGTACDRCGTPIRRVSFMNRSSYFCPVCQPAPRVNRAGRGRAGR